jgi:hypothetical protein
MNIIFKDNSKKVLDESEKAIEQALLAVGLQAEGHCKNELSRTPKRIDTGLLRNSITFALGGKPANTKTYHAEYGENRHTTGKNAGKRIRASSKNAGSVKVGRYSGNTPRDLPFHHSVWIGTNVEYATYVHNGTFRMAANRFIRNGITRFADEYKRIVKKFLQDK